MDNNNNNKRQFVIIIIIHVGCRRFHSLEGAATVVTADAIVYYCRRGLRPWGDTVRDVLGIRRTPTSGVFFVSV